MIFLLVSVNNKFFEFINKIAIPLAAILFTYLNYLFLKKKYINDVKLALFDKRTKFLEEFQSFFFNYLLSTFNSFAEKNNKNEEILMKLNILELKSIYLFNIDDLFINLMKIYESENYNNKISNLFIEYNNIINRIKNKHLIFNDI